MIHKNILEYILQRVQLSGRLKLLWLNNLIQYYVLSVVKLLLMLVEGPSNKLTYCGSFILFTLSLSYLSYFIKPGFLFLLGWNLWNNSVLSNSIPEYFSFYRFVAHKSKVLSPLSILLALNVLLFNRKAK